MCGRQRISHRNCWYLFGKSSLHLFYEGLARRHQRQFNDGWLVTQISPSLHSALSSAGTIGIGSVPNRKGDQIRDRRFKFAWESRNRASGSVDHVTGKNNHARDVKILVDPTLVLVPVLQDQTRVAPARMNVSPVVPGVFRGTLIPFLRLRP